MDRGLMMPFEIGSVGLPRTAPRARLIRQQLEHVLFTLPGERVNRPDFGCGVQRLIFAGASRELAAAAEFTISTGIKRFLGDLIRLDAVRVTTNDATLTIDILYTLIETGEELADTFARPLGDGAG